LRKLRTFLDEKTDPDAIDREGEIPDSVFEGLAEMGAFGIKIPGQYGGLGLSQTNYSRAAMLLGGHCGNLTALLTAIKGLPLTYNRDLQEDKEPLFDSIDTLTLALKVNTEMIAEMKINEEVCQAAASDPLLLATDLADWLVKQGVPFRSAHELVGKAVAASVTSDTPLDQLDLTTVDPAFTSEASSVFDLQTALAARTNPGAPSLENVRAQITRWQELVGGEE
jgi:argininosuccinate lyase